MSFRDDTQLARACEALCARIGKGPCWVVDPAPSATTFAIDVLDGKVGLSHGEALVILAAWAFWNGSGRVQFDELMVTLSHGHQQAIFELAIARSAGAAAVDRWLDKYEVDRTRSSARKAGSL